MADVEGVLDGNICRCTGYRPIFDAFKSLAVDAPRELKDKLVDIEDLSRSMTCPKTSKPCEGLCGRRGPNEVQFLRTGAGEWMKPENLYDLLAILNSFAPGHSYRMVAGNTGTGRKDSLLEDTVYELCFYRYLPGRSL